MSTQYYGERVAVDATKALLLLLKYGSRKIAELVLGLKKEGFDLSAEQTRSLARRLRDKRYLEGSARQGYSMTQEGLKRLETLSLSKIAIPSEWDGKWRLIMFDIPEESRLLRNQLRQLIKELLCVKLQQSVWVHPFPCFKQFRQIRDAYGVNEHVLLIETDAIEDASYLLKVFRQLYPSTKFRMRTK